MTLDECSNTVERLLTDLQGVVDYFRFGDDQDALPALATLILAQLGLNEVARRLRKRRLDRKQVQQQFQPKEESEYLQLDTRRYEAYDESSPSRSKTTSSMEQTPDNLVVTPITSTESFAFRFPSPVPDPEEDMSSVMMEKRLQMIQRPLHQRCSRRRNLNCQRARTLKNLANRRRSLWIHQYR